MREHKQQLTLDETIQLYIIRSLKVCLILAIGLALALVQWETFFYSVLALLLILLPEVIENRTAIKVPIEFEVTIAIFVFASIFLGEVGDAYELYWWWDALLHISSGFILGFAGFLLLYIKVSQNKLKANNLIVGLIIFSLGMAFGAVWEIFEFGVDGFFGTNMQKNGLHDTMWDLIVDGGGALVVALLGSRYIQSGGKGFLDRWIRSFIKLNPGMRK